MGDKEEDDDANGDNIDGNEDTFIASNCRAAKLDQENNELRYRVSHINSTITEFYQVFNEITSTAEDFLNTESGDKLKESAEKLGALIYKPVKKLSVGSSKDNSSTIPSSDDEGYPTHNSENVQLKVKMELEHERRLRTQQALDDAERRYFVLNREY